VQQAFVNLQRGNPGQVPAPDENAEADWSPRERAVMEHMLMYSFLGSPTTVANGLRQFIEKTEADEVMIAGHFYDHKARLRSFELASEVRDRLNASVPENHTKVGAS
jgi:alkanesulfonate monooxygenase SsuD/methylene tetrahydromethanopterin reductase-like flavin-dependent oxidoreductase (luciferase family)